MRQTKDKVKRKTGDDGRNNPITTTNRDKKAKTNAGKLSLYPLSVEDALGAAAHTGRISPAKSKGLNRDGKKRAAPT